MKVVHNPTDIDLVDYNVRGELHTIKAHGDSQPMSDRDAVYMKEQVSFLRIQNVPVEVVEVVTEPAAEVVEVVEELVEKPKKKRVKKLIK